MGNDMFYNTPGRRNTGRKRRSTGGFRWFAGLRNMMRGDDDSYGGLATAGRSKVQSDPPVWRLADAVMTCLTLAGIVAALLTLPVPYFSPTRLGVLPVLALVAPLVFVCVVIAMLYWIVRWKWRRASVMIVLALACMLHLPRYFNPQFRRSYDDDKNYPRSAMRVMSYNVRCFFPDDHSADYTTDSIAAFVRQFNPDVICFQEFLPHSAQMRHRFDSLLGGDYRVAVMDAAHPPIAIYSRFRIASSERVAYLDADSVKRGKGMWADLLVGNDTVRVFNVHLNGTSISRDDADYIVNYRYMSDSARNSKLHDIVRRLNNNTVNRSYHVDELAAAMQATDRAKILCGDFNDTPMSYAYHTLARDMKDAFCECGSGYSHTFRGFFDLLRIDFALFDDRHFDVVSYEVPDSVCWSDHLPVCVRVELQRET